MGVNIMAKCCKLVTMVTCGCHGNINNIYYYDNSDIYKKMGRNYNNQGLMWHFVVVEQVSSKAMCRTGVEV